MSQVAKPIVQTIILEQRGTMAREKYTLNSGERIVYKVTGVKYGSRGNYDQTLVITNQSIIFEQYGIFGNFKGITRYNYNEIDQVMNRKNSLDILKDGHTESFQLWSDKKLEIQVLKMAIDDQMGPDAELYDYNHYQNIIEEAEEAQKLIELRAKAEREQGVIAGSSNASNVGVKMVGNVAKNLMRSGDFSIGGVTKAVSKAAKKQQRNSLFDGLMDELKEEAGYWDIMDEITEFKNEFREEHGLPTEMTHAERMELAELEEKARKRQIQVQQEKTTNDIIAKQRAIIEENKNSNGNDETKTVKEQIELLQQLKNLLDAGILTQEEFDAKKQEILN